MEHGPIWSLGQVTQSKTGGHRTKIRVRAITSPFPCLHLDLFMRAVATLTGTFASMGNAILPMALALRLGLSMNSGPFLGVARIRIIMVYSKVYFARYLWIPPCYCSLQQSDCLCTMYLMNKHRKGNIWCSAPGAMPAAVSFLAVFGLVPLSEKNSGCRLAAWWFAGISSNVKLNNQSVVG